jgi:hypothetical protein
MAPGAAQQPPVGSLSLPSSSRAPVISVHARKSDDFSVPRLSRDDGAAGQPLYRSRSAGKSDAAYFHLPATSSSLHRSLSASRADSVGSRSASKSDSVGSPSQLDAAPSPVGRRSHFPAILPHASFFVPRRPARSAQQTYSRTSESVDGHTIKGGISQVSLGAVGGDGTYPGSVTSTSPPPSTWGRPSISSSAKPDSHFVPHSSHLSEEASRRQSEETRSHHDDYESDYAMATSDGGHSSTAHYELRSSTPSNVATYFSPSDAPKVSVGALSLADTDTNTSTESRGQLKPSTAQPSREPLLDFPLTTLPEAGTTSNSSNKSVRRPSRISGDVVARVRNSFSSPSAVYAAGEKQKTAGLEKLSESVGRSSLSGPLSGQEGYVLSQTGLRLRNFELHRGAHRFFLGGRLITSRDASWPFLCSLFLAVALPAAFLVFNAEWIWVWKGAAGKVVVVIFAYLTLVMWSSLVRAALRDPGICKLF